MLCVYRRGLLRLYDLINLSFIIPASVERWIGLFQFC